MNYENKMKVRDDGKWLKFISRGLFFYAILESSKWNQVDQEEYGDEKLEKVMMDQVINCISKKLLNVNDKKNGIG